MKKSSETNRIMDTKKLMTDTHDTITTSTGDVIPIKHILEGIFDSIWVCNLRYDDKVEIYQEASMKLFKYFGKHFFPDKFKPYAYGRSVGWNMVVNFLKRKDKAEIPFSRLEIPGEDGDIFSPIERMSSQMVDEDDIFGENARCRLLTEERLWDTVESLKGNYRDILIMRFRDNMEYKEIAEELGIKVEVAHKWANRAREALEKRLGTRFLDEYLDFAA